jgi:hypothetical protein
LVEHGLDLGRARGEHDFELGGIGEHGREPLRQIALRSSIPPLWPVSVVAQAAPSVYSSTVVASLMPGRRCHQNSLNVKSIFLQGV